MNIHLSSILKIIQNILLKTIVNSISYVIDFFVSFYYFCFEKYCNYLRVFKKRHHIVLISEQIFLRKILPFFFLLRERL